MAAPTVATVGANAITQTTANLIGSVNPDALATTWWFSYGTTTSLGTVTPTLSAGSGSLPVTVTAEITGLTTGTTYYFAVVGSNSSGTVTSYTLSFVAQAPATVTNASQPIEPFGAPAIDIPHFRFPFTITDSGAVTVEQDSIDEIFANVQVIANCLIGDCPEYPSFGIPDPTFSPTPISAAPLVQAIQQWEPRADEQIATRALTDTGESWQIALTTSSQATDSQ